MNNLMTITIIVLMISNVMLWIKYFRFRIMLDTYLKRELKFRQEVSESLNEIDKTLKEAINNE